MRSALLFDNLIYDDAASGLNYYAYFATPLRSMTCPPFRIASYRVIYLVTYLLLDKR